MAVKLPDPKLFKCRHCEEDIVAYEHRDNAMNPEGVVWICRNGHRDWVLGHRHGERAAASSSQAASPVVEPSQAGASQSDPALPLAPYVEEREKRGCGRAVVGIGTLVIAIAALALAVLALLITGFPSLSLAPMALLGVFGIIVGRAYWRQGKAISLILCLIFLFLLLLLVVQGGILG